ncbi:MAG: O-antigen ligase family protein, partial [Acidobacteria bacterium]|nr:O-antigen ligase family protein [Acidobacteriota bacterium]
MAGLFAFWCGTFHGGSGAWAATAACASILALAGIVGRTLHPLSGGGSESWLLGASVVVLLASWWTSPVPRAGLSALLLLPAFLLLPSALAAAWQSEAARRRGLSALSLTVFGASVWALADRYLAGSPRAAMPLGHHNLLAVWLVTLLPMAALGARGRGPARALAAAAALAGTAALIATGSWAGGVALALEIAVAAVVLEPRLRRWRWLGGATVFLALAVLVSLPRLRGLLEGSDTSWSAREAYLSAGWRGFLERPLLGWGPGSTPWTLAEFLEPLPGIHPSGELVGDLHNLPLQLLYELGASGGALFLISFVLLLARSTSEARDRPLAVAAKLGWLGFGVASLGGAPLSVLALPMALAVVLGAWQAALPGPGFPRTPRVRRWFPWVVA